MPSGETWAVTNDDAGLHELVPRLLALRPTLVVLEATGGVETAAVAACAQADADADLQLAASKTLAFTNDITYLRGTGVGQALGILNAPTLITITPETGQAANSIIYTNIVKMVARLLPLSWGNAVWVVHPSTVTQLLTPPCHKFGHSKPDFRMRS